MPTQLPFLTLHASQIKEIAASIGAQQPLAVQVKASADNRDIALRACGDASVEIPKAGAFTQTELDAAAASAFPKEHPSHITNRIAFKQKVWAGGLLLEKSPINQETVVRAG